MKKLIFITSLLLINTHLFAALDSNASCDTELNDHLKLVSETNAAFSKLASEKNTELSSYQVTTFEHLFATRIKHIDTLKNTTCEKQGARELIIQSDMIDLSKTVFSDFKLRRIVAVLNKFKKDEYKGLKKMYRKYTMSETLEENLDLLKSENNEEEVSKLNLDLDLSNIKPMTSISDVAVRALSGAIGGFAILWGKLSDATVWREGHLKGNTEAYDLLKSKLKPFDLIYESRNYTLSHFTIPGHFGHVAIWMGSKEELQAMGLWDQEFMAPFKTAIENGKNIIEIRKPGIQFVDLHDFINLDETAVTRIKNIEQNAEGIFKNLLEQFGKKYDFAFDAHSSNKITCAELVSFTFGDINWPMSAKASVVNLRPDDMAMYGILNPDKAEFVAYLKGNADNKTFENLDSDAFTKLFK